MNSFNKAMRVLSGLVYLARMFGRFFCRKALFWVKEQGQALAYWAMGRRWGVWVLDRVGYFDRSSFDHRESEILPSSYPKARLSCLPSEFVQRHFCDYHSDNSGKVFFLALNRQKESESNRFKDKKIRFFRLFHAGLTVGLFFSGEVAWARGTGNPKDLENLDLTTYQMNEYFEGIEKQGCFLSQDEARRAIWRLGGYLENCDIDMRSADYWRSFHYLLPTDRLLGRLFARNRSTSKIEKGKDKGALLAGGERMDVLQKKAAKKGQFYIYPLPPRIPTRLALSLRGSCESVERFLSLSDTPASDELWAKKHGKQFKSYSELSLCLHLEGDLLFGLQKPLVWPFLSTPEREKSTRQMDRVFFDGALSEQTEREEAELLRSFDAMEEKILEGKEADLSASYKAFSSQFAPPKIHPANQIVSMEGGKLDPAKASAIAKWAGTFSGLGGLSDLSSVTQQVEQAMKRARKRRDEEILSEVMEGELANFTWARLVEHAEAFGKMAGIEQATALRLMLLCMFYALRYFDALAGMVAAKALNIKDIARIGELCEKIDALEAVRDRGVEVGEGLAGVEAFEGIANSKIEALENERVRVIDGQIEKERKDYEIRIRDLLRGGYGTAILFHVATNPDLQQRLEMDEEDLADRGDYHLQVFSNYLLHTKSHIPIHLWTADIGESGQITEAGRTKEAVAVFLRQMLPFDAWPWLGGEAKAVQSVHFFQSDVPSALEHHLGLFVECLSASAILVTKGYEKGKDCIEKEIVTSTAIADFRHIAEIGAAMWRRLEKDAQEEEDKIMSAARRIARERAKASGWDASDMEMFGVDASSMDLIGDTLLLMGKRARLDAALAGVAKAIDGGLIDPPSEFQPNHRNPIDVDELEGIDTACPLLFFPCGDFEYPRAAKHSLLHYVSSLCQEDREAFRNLGLQEEDHEEA